MGRPTGARTVSDRSFATGLNPEPYECRSIRVVTVLRLRRVQQRLSAVVVPNYVGADARTLPRELIARRRALEAQAHSAQKVHCAKAYTY